MPDDFVVPVSNADSCLRQEAESPLWQAFSAEFLELLQPDNPTAISLGAFLRRTLRVFHLLDIHSEMEVLSEIYIRAHRLIHDEFAEIRNPSAWVRKTAHNVMRKWSRKGQRSTALDWGVIDEREENREHELALETDVAILDKAWRSLTPAEQRLLTFKITKNRFWKEIADIYARKGKSIAKSALRQQKARTLRHLRRVYHTLKPLTNTIPTAELITRQPQRQINHPLTVDMQRTINMRFVVSYYRQLISKSGTPGNLGQVNRHKFAYLTGIAAQG